MNILQSISRAQRDASYNPSRGWSTTAQPHNFQTVEEYHSVASDAALDLSQKLKDFCDDNELSYIEIPFEDFLKYEQGSQNFRDWLNAYAKKNKTTARADLAIIQPRVKSLESCRRKTSYGDRPMDRIKDYLGAQFVILKKTRSKNNSQSLNNLQKAIQAIEENVETRAIKNQYWSPHKQTGFRGHKSLWVQQVTSGENAGKSILAEIKIEHESQMDIDKLTRKFMDIARAAGKAMEKFATSATPRSGKRNNIRSNKEQDKRDAFNALGKILYNRVFKDSGLNQFMDPTVSDSYPPLPVPALFEAAKETIYEHYPKSGQDELLQTVTSMSMFPKSGKSKTRRPSKGKHHN